MDTIMDWKTFISLAGLIAAWSLVIIATTRWVVSAGLKSLREQFINLEELVNQNYQDQKNLQQEMNFLRPLNDSFKSSSEAQQKLTRDVLELKADLPLSYVRREDFIRNELVINTKLDRLRDMVAGLQTRKES